MIQKYLKILFDLLPPGLFDIGEDSNIKKLLTAVATELHRAESHMNSEAEAITPTTTVGQYLKKWAVMTGQRDGLRASVLAQLRKAGGANKSVFLGILNSLGLDDSAGRVEEIIAPSVCNGPCTQGLYSGNQWRVAFKVQIPRRIEIMTCNSPCDSFLVAQFLEANALPIRVARPAHTSVFFETYV